MEQFNLKYPLNGFSTEGYTLSFFNHSQQSVLGRMGHYVLS